MYQVSRDFGSQLHLEMLICIDGIGIGYMPTHFPTPGPEVPGDYMDLFIATTVL